LGYYPDLSNYLFGEIVQRMTTTVQFCVAGETKMAAVSLLAKEVFDEFVSPFYSQEGREEFHRYAATEALQERNRRDHATLIAESGGRIVGMLHLRQWQHVAMLFVARSHQRGGVGRALLRAAAELVRQHDPSSCRLTVNSSPNAVAAYRRLGFSLVGPEQVIRGIRFLPMEIELTEALAEPGAPPNGGPATRFGNSGVTEGRPSVS
jgi:GNAT superfamily N-acetyltransferase